jgi:hypothetical protein
MIAIPSRSQKKRWWRKDESLGGLIAQRFLLTHRNYASLLPFSYFCSTPESSAQVAKLGHF